jgi:high-affinity iron transporter
MDARLRCLVCAAGLVTALLFAHPPATAGTDVEGTHRLLTLVRGVGEEYREALDAEGRVVRPIELEEARLFLLEARQHAERLGTRLPGEVTGGLAALANTFERRAPLDALEAEVDAICSAISRATGVAEENFPTAPPSPARGQAIFATHCVSCHGERGAGDGPEAARLERKPADFTDAHFMRGETPADFFHVISLGRRVGAMPAWDAVLSPAERWDAISHVWSLHTPAENVVEGQGVFLAHCAGCHGANGDARGAYRDALPAPPADMSAPGALVQKSDAQLYAAVTDGIAGTPMPAFARALDDDERWKVVAYVRALSLGGLTPTADGSGETPAPEGSGSDPGGAFAKSERLVDSAASAYERGDRTAGDLATDAYLAFEPLEASIRARNPAAVTAAEEAFLRLRGALRTPGGDVTDEVADVRRALRDARAALGAGADGYARFAQSFAIILREGFEVVLIVGALLAYVVKSGNTAMKRPIYGGVALGVVASIATAVLLATVFRLSPGLSELLEGAAMLLAAVVLFWVSYWIISKAEAERWQRYIHSKVQHAVAAGSGVALAAAAFLAVYREGFETVLFYQALLGSAPAGDVMVLAGFVAGSAALAVVYVVFSRFGVRIPIREFFLASGALLYGMSFAFAGRGIHELQEAGAIGVTPVAWAPQVPVLGIFPTLESLLAQGVLLVLLVYAVTVTLRGTRRAEADALRAEIAGLRERAEAMRAELAGLHAVHEAAALGARLDELLGEVRALEKRVPGNGRG